MSLRLQRYGLILLAFYAILFVGGYGANIPALVYFNHVLLTVLGFTWLAWRWRRGLGLPPSPLNLPLFAMLSIGFLTIPFSYDPRTSLEVMWQPIIFSLVFWFLVNAFHRAQDRLIMEILFLFAAIMIFFGFLQVGSVFFGWGLLPGTSTGWIEFLGTGIPFPVQQDLRIYVPLGVSTQVAGVIAPLMIVTLAWAITTAHKSYRIIFSIMFVLMSIILFLTFSRGGLVSLMAGLSVFVVLRFIQLDSIRKILSKRNLIVFSSLISLTIVITAWILFISSDFRRRSGDSLRIDLWQSALAMTIDNPVTGVGTGMYGRALREYRQIDTPDDRLSTAHNIYLTVTAEHGITVIAITILTAWLIGRLWLKRRQEMSVKSSEWIRLNGMMAALIAFAVHNLFDTLTTFAGIALFSVLVVYCTVKPAKSRLDAPPQGNRWASALIMTIVLAYGIWFVALVDPARRHFNNSLEPEYDQMTEIQRAINLDPFLNLYHLQHTYLLGEQAINNPTAENLSTAIASYEGVLAIEPTWDTGMINLAALYELDGNLEAAQTWLDRARQINVNNTANLHWARIAEMTDTAEESDIVEAYVLGMRYAHYLPLSEFWSQTQLRIQALEAYMEQFAPHVDYQIARVHFPERLEAIVPENPQSNSEWWVVGEHLLTVENDREAAIDAFNMAIALNPDNGDYYVSRARAIGTSDPEAAQQNLDIARLFGTVFEYPNIVNIQLTDDPEQIERYRTNAIPGYPLNQAFEAVLFGGRRAEFVPYRPMRFIGRGESILQVWYDLAADYEAAGDIESAINVYEAIAFITPEDDRALAAIQRLQP